MCFVKCGDLSPSSETKFARDEIEMLSGNKNTRDYRIRKLLDKGFIGESKYIAMRDSGKNDKEILDELGVEAEKGGFKKEFDLLINSGKEKVNSLLEL